MYAIDSGLRPYLSHVEFERHVQRIMKQRHAQRHYADAMLEASKAMIDEAQEDEPDSLIQVSGDYCEDLLGEVTRYAKVAGRIVRRGGYDLIHAHDWMTFLAGVEAKRISGLPLVVHVHATEFDRCGEDIDQRIYDIER